MTVTSDRIKSLRLKKNMSQNELATKLGIGRSNMGHIENGRVEPTKESIVLLSEIFGVTTDYLLGRTDNPVAGLSKKAPFTVEEALASVMSSDGKPLTEHDRIVLTGIIEAYLEKNANAE